MQEVEFQNSLSLSPDTVTFDSTTKKSSTIKVGAAIRLTMKGGVICGDMRLVSFLHPLGT